MKIYQLTATELRSLLEEKKVSSEEIVEALLERIEAVDSRVRAFIRVDGRRAISAARVSDRRRKHGRAGILEGIPVAVKDNICTAGIKTTCGSKMLRNFIPAYDAHVIEKIKAAGGIVLGKTNLDEFLTSFGNSRL